MGVDFDKILAEVGGKGKYQLIRYFLLAAIPIAMSWHLVGMFHLILLVWPDPNKMNCGWKLIVVSQRAFSWFWVQNMCKVTLLWLTNTFWHILWDLLLFLLPRFKFYRNNSELKHKKGNALISAAPAHRCVPSQYSPDYPATHISADYVSFAI